MLTKDFAETNYQNPKNLQKQNKLKRKISVFGIILLIIIIILFIYVLLFSPYLKIQQIEINGLNNIKEKDLRQIIDFELNRGIIFKHNNILLFSINSLKENIESNYVLEWLEIKKKIYPPQIQISLLEKVSALTYITDENCFNIDIQGFIIEKCNSFSSDFIQIRNANNQNTEIGQQVLKPEVINYIINLNEALKGQGTNIRTFIIVSADSSDLRILTEQGFEIYFNTNLEINDQLTRLNILIREEIGEDNLDNIDYIDLRFGEKVFYR